MRVKEKTGPPGEKTEARPHAPFLLGSPDTPDSTRVESAKGAAGLFRHDNRSGGRNRYIPTERFPREVPCRPPYVVLLWCGRVIERGAQGGYPTSWRWFLRNEFSP